MTDNELIAALNLKLGSNCIGVLDNPFTNWNHTWIIVEAMRKRGWSLEWSINHRGNEYVGFIRKSDHFATTDLIEPGNEQRAILLAALRALLELESE